MDIFFNSKYKYIVDEPLEDVRDKIQSITSRKWDDFSENITGRRGRNGSYILRTKWSFIYTSGIEGSGAYITVKLKEEGSRTELNVLLRPNTIFVLLFYTIAVVFFLELFGVTLINGSKVYALLFLPFFDLIFFGIIRLFTLGLKRRFERIMRM